MVERVVYVGATLQVFLHLASGQTIQAWIPNDGDAQSRASGDAIAGASPGRRHSAVLPGGGTAVLAAAELGRRERLIRSLRTGSRGLPGRRRCADPW